MTGMDFLREAMAAAKAGEQPVSFGRADPPETPSQHYARLLTEARRAATQLNAERQEIDRLEALAEGRGPHRIVRLARPLSLALLLAGLAAFGFVTEPQTAVLAGVLVNAFWCGDQAGLAWRRTQRGGARLREAVILLGLAGHACLLALAVEGVFGWSAAALVPVFFLPSVVTGFLGSSGDVVADRIHGELFAARIAARTTESRVSELEEALRTLQSADLATLSRVAPWPVSRMEETGEDE